MKSAASQQVFYYHFKTNWIWFALTSVLLAAILYCIILCPITVYWWQTWSLIGCCVYSFALWAFKYLCRHKMAIIDDKYIKIDHNRPLPWRMVAFAELKTVRCCFKKLPIIIFHTKKPLHYRFNLMQKWCSHLEFTPFSIALYALKPEDANTLAVIIAQKTALLG